MLILIRSISMALIFFLSNSLMTRFTHIMCGEVRIQSLNSASAQIIPCSYILNISGHYNDIQIPKGITCGL